jgi:hypothetical protein
MKAKRARVMAQVIEHLPSKLKALNSNPNTKNREKKSHKRFL